MNAPLFLNPYAFIVKQGDRFVLNSSPQMQVVFSGDNQRLIDYLLAAEPIELPTLARYIAPARIQELVNKRVLLSEPLPDEGRYSRQLGFLSFVVPRASAAQSRLAHARVLILGAGAVGSHVLWNLAAIGVGHITVVDFDTVEESNLNRQLMYWPEDIGKSKVEVITRRIAAFNPTIEVTPVNRRIASPADIEALLDNHGIVVKAIDTPPESNAWVNAVCVRNAIPYITGGFLGNLGVVGPLYIPEISKSCLACLAEPSAERVSGTGPTFAPLTTIVASMMSMTVFKILMGLGETVRDRILIYDVASDRWDNVPMVTQAACDTCGGVPPPAARSVDPDAAVRLAYRSGILVLTMVASLLRIFTDNGATGVLLVLMLLTSVPVLDTLCTERRSVNRELFVVAVSYILIATITFIIVNHGLPVRQLRVRADAFGYAAAAAALTIQACLATTVLFFALAATRAGWREIRAMWRSQLAPDR